MNPMNPLLIRDQWKASPSSESLRSQGLAVDGEPLTPTAFLARSLKALSDLPSSDAFTGAMASICSQAFEQSFDPDSLMQILEVLHDRLRIHSQDFSIDSTLCRRDFLQSMVSKRSVTQEQHFILVDAFSEMNVFGALSDSRSASVESLRALLEAVQLDSSTSPGSTRSPSPSL